MKENSKRIMTVSGAIMTALAIALSLLAFLTVTTRAATGTGMPAMSDVIPGEDGTSALPLPEAGNVDTDDVVTPNDTTRTPTVTTSTPNAGSTPSGTTAGTPGAASGDGTDTGMAEEDGGSILGAVIAVIVVVAIILAVIALMPRKKR